PELLQSADAVLGVSRPMLEQLQQWGAPAERLHYAPCGAAMNHFSPANPAKNPPEILAAGRSVAKKGILDTISAFHLAVRAEPTAHLTIIGAGPMERQAKNYVRQHQLESAITFTGPLPHREVAHRMARARAVILAARTAPDGDQEG